MPQFLRHTIIFCSACATSGLAQAQSPGGDPWAAVEADITGSETITFEEVSPVSNYVRMTYDYVFDKPKNASFSRQSSGFVGPVIELGSSYEHQFSTGVQLKLSGLARGQRDISDDQMKFELDYGESYVHIPVSDQFWIRAGALNISYGTSEVFKILDRFNPRFDQGWGLDGASTERLIQPGMQARYTNGDHQIQLALTAMNRSDKVDQPYGDFDYFIQDRAFADIEANPDNSDFTPEWIASYQYFGADADFGFYVGSTYENHPVLKGDGLMNGRAQLSYNYPRTDYAGISASYTKGSWLVRTDLAYFKDQTFFNNGYYQQIYIDRANALSQLQSDVFSGVVGIEYTEISKTILSLEAKYQKLFDWQPSIRAEEESVDVAASASTLLMSDRLELEAKVASLSDSKMSSYSLGADYEFNDNLTGTAEIISYQVNDKGSYFAPYQNNDRAQIALKYNF